MAERGFGEPSERRVDADREAFEKMKFDAEERHYRENKYFGLATLLALFAVAMGVIAIIVSVSRG